MDTLLFILGSRLGPSTGGKHVILYLIKINWKNKSLLLMGNILQALPQAATHLILIYEVITPLKKVTPCYSIFFIFKSCGQLPTKKTAL